MMTKKKLIITIDTEGDNLWNWKRGEVITTENVLFLDRFQTLCDEYGFKPVWLSNYEMMKDHRYLDFIGKVESDKRGELGMHLHAWNTPPIYDLPIVNECAPYLIEYPDEIIEEKIFTMTELIKDFLGKNPVSHRAGRWAMNDSYFGLLEKYGYKVDCSVTPGVNWIACKGQTEGSCGSDYSSYSMAPCFLEKYQILETPVTVINSRKFFLPEKLCPRKIAKSLYNSLKGQLLWLRPNGKNLKQMLYLSKCITASKNDYLMFMIHSSEFMPGGSNTFKTEASIESLYNDLRKLFESISESYEGITLRDYYSEYICKSGV